jgi:serine/threonine-protein kinase
MGHVYRAFDELLERPVAIKLLDTQASQQPGLGASLADEARATARVSHPGIVQVFDVGDQDGTSYIVMELLEGRSLREILRESRSVPADQALDLAAQLADALDAIHRHRLVHCDVKPANIIVTPAAHPKLVDFGIARAGTAIGQTPSEEIRGSAPYVSPEQVRGEQLDGRTDVYALGAVLYEMLLGQPPYVGPSATAVASQRLSSDPVRPRVLDARIAPEIDATIMRALARDPAQRYPSAADLRDALRSAQGRLVARPEPATQPLIAPSRAMPAPRRGVALAVLVGALLLAGGTLAIARVSSDLGHRQPGVPGLVGHRLSEVPTLLESAGIAPADVTVLARPVGGRYVGLVVDQQPQPGLPVDSQRPLQIAVGVAQ